MSSYLDIGALQSGSGLDIGPLQSAGTAPLTETLSDSYTISDSFSLAIPIAFSFADSFSFYDSIQLEDQVSLLLLGDTLQWNWDDHYTSGGGATINVLISDNNNNLADAITVAGIQPAFLFTDSYTISDIFQLDLNLPYTFNDSFTIADSSTVQLQTPLGYFFSEFINIQDAITIQLNTALYETISDSYTIQDSEQDVINLPLRFGDIIPPYFDFVQRGGTNNSGLLLVDFYFLGDSCTINEHLRFVFDDAVTFNDSIATFKNNTSDIFNDSLSILDGVTISLSMPSTLTINGDSLSIQDNVLTDVSENLNSYLRRYLNDVVRIN